MADVHCPMTKDIRPMAGCLACVNHVKDGTSLEWCRYREPELQKEQPEEIPVNAVEMQIREKISKSEYFYKRGMTRIAGQLSDDAAYLEINLRRRKRNVEKA